MDFKRIFDLIERWLGRVHLVVWILDLTASIGSGLWALKVGFPWLLICLTALGAFVLAMLLLATIYKIAMWVIKKAQKISQPRGLKIVFGSGAPFHTYKTQIYKKNHLIKIGLKNNSLSVALTNCELTLESISGVFSDRCPISIKAGFVLNPGAEIYCEFVGMDESGMEAAYDIKGQRYGIRAYFPINPLPSDQSSWLDDQPYKLVLKATAAESKPDLMECCLYVEDGYLKLDTI